MATVGFLYVGCTLRNNPTVTFCINVAHMSLTSAVEGRVLHGQDTRK